MKYLIIILCLSTSLALAPGCSGNTGRLVARVNDTPLYTYDVVKAIAAERTKYDDHASLTAPGRSELARSSLEVLIQETILLDEAKRLDISVSDEEFNAELTDHFGTADRTEIKTFLAQKQIDPDFWLKTQRNKIAIRKLIGQEVMAKIPVTELEITNYYQKNLKDFDQPRLFRARQILVDTRARADEIMHRLAKGETFSELAQKYSLSPDSARGGDLGFFSTTDFPPVFGDICARLKPGEISDIKETAYGFQIFQLLDKRPPRTRPLDEVRGEIIDRIRAERSAEAFAAWFTDLRARSHIMIVDEALREVEDNVATPHS